MLYHKTKKSTLLSAVSVGAVIFAMMIALLPAAYAEGSDPWTTIPEDQVTDWGEMWGTVIQFEYTYDPEIGNQAQSIEWDFGDGSPRSEEWNPQHTYTEHGTYTIVQHVTNTYDGFSEDWGYYRLTIMGKPYVEVVTPEGAEPIGKIYATKGTAPEMPAVDPVWNDYDFVGYFLDEEYTVPFDWTVLIDTPVTVFAVFEDGTYVPPVTDDPDEPTDPTEPGGLLTDISTSMLILIVVGAGFGLVALYTRNPVIALITLILIAVAILGITDVIDIPDFMEMIG